MSVESVPVCTECQIFPVFEYICITEDGREFSQGFGTMCYACADLDKSPQSWIVDHSGLQRAENVLSDQNNFIEND